MVSTIPSGVHICTKHTTHLCLLKPPMEEHSVLGWGEPFFFFLGGEGADPSEEATFCTSILLSDLFWKLSDSWWLAHKEGVALFGKLSADILAKLFTAAWTECGVCFTLRPCKVDAMEIWWGAGGFECYISALWLGHIAFYFHGTRTEIGEGNRVKLCQGSAAGHTVSPRAYTVPTFQ